MPVQRVPGGYRWGNSGKVYPSRSQAAAQGRAIHASGYKPKGNKANASRTPKKAK